MAAGDVNGDGFDDVLIGATGDDTPFQDAGATWLYLGSASGLSTTPGTSTRGEDADAFFGSAVASGDLDGDGSEDLLVGAVGYGRPEFQEGAVFLYLGNPVP